MKQVKKTYKECKAKLPNRPPDEIDFGLGFRAALEWIYKEAKELCNSPEIPVDAFDLIEEELK